MNMYAAYYEPSTGAIIQWTSGDRASIEADPRPFVELPARPPIGLDRTHRVVDGAIVPIEP